MNGVLKGHWLVIAVPIVCGRAFVINRSCALIIEQCGEGATGAGYP